MHEFKSITDDLDVLSWPDIRNIAQEYMDGKLTQLMVAAILGPYCDAFHSKAGNAFGLLSDISDQTDAILLGERRSLWHPDVRAGEDEKHDKAQEWARPYVEEACLEILAVSEA